MEARHASNTSRMTMAEVRDAAGSPMVPPRPNCWTSGRRGRTARMEGDAAARVDHAVNRCAGTEPERQRHHGHRRKCPLPGEQPRAYRTSRHNAYHRACRCPFETRRGFPFGWLGLSHFTVRWRPVRRGSPVEGDRGSRLIAARLRRRSAEQQAAPPRRAPSRDTGDTHSQRTLRRSRRDWPRATILGVVLLARHGSRS